MIDGSDWYDKYQVTWNKDLPPDPYEIDKLTHLKEGVYRLKILAGRMLLFKYTGECAEGDSGYPSGAFVVAPHTWTYIKTSISTPSPQEQPRHENAKLEFDTSHWFFVFWAEPWCDETEEAPHPQKYRLAATEKHRS